MKSKVFVSSTFYNFVDCRSEIRELIVSMGYEPLMNEYPTDFLLNTSLDSYNECLEKVKEADIFILLLGTRYGGIIPGKNNSITEEEYNRALNLNIPRLNCCLKEVWTLNRIYNINKDTLKFPKDYDNGHKLMDFLNKIRRIDENKADNWVNTFDNVTELKSYLRKQLLNIEASKFLNRKQLVQDLHGVIVPDKKLNNLSEIFVVGNKFNGIVVVGDSYKHGRYNKKAHAIDALMAGHLVNYFGCFTEKDHCIKFDTWVTEDELINNNLVLIGGPYINVQIDYLNDNDLLFVYYNRSKDALTSKVSCRDFDSRFYGAVQLIINPYNPEKYILVCLGHSGPGTIASVLSVSDKYRIELVKNNFINNEIPAKVMLGSDLDNDQWVDTIEFLE